MATDEHEIEEASAEYGEPVTVSFELEPGQPARATYERSLDGQRGRIRVWYFDLEIRDASDVWSSRAPEMEPEDVEEWARERLRTLVKRNGPRFPEGHAFVVDMRERFAPSPKPAEVSDELDVKAEAYVEHGGLKLHVTWEESADGQTAAAKAFEADTGKFLFDDVWRDGRGGASWDAESLADWAVEQLTERFNR